MADDYKKYDSEDSYRIEGVRLAKDADVKETGSGNLVTLTFVSTSRNDGDSDLWIEAKVADRQADLAAHLQKGDVLHVIEGKPALRRYGENNEKFAFQLRRARMTVPIGMFAELKERGWTPGAKGDSKPARQPVKSNRKPARHNDGLDDEIPF